MKCLFASALFPPSLSRGSVNIIENLLPLLAVRILFLRLFHSNSDDDCGWSCCRLMGVRRRCLMAWQSIGESRITIDDEYVPREEAFQGWYD